MGSSCLGAISAATVSCFVAATSSPIVSCPAATVFCLVLETSGSDVSHPTAGSRPPIAVLVPCSTHKAKHVRKDHGPNW